MNSYTGQVYPSLQEAVADLKPPATREDIVEVVGTPEAVGRLSAAVKANAARRHAANKRARASRRRHNRGR